MSISFAELKNEKEKKKRKSIFQKNFWFPFSRKIDIKLLIKFSNHLVSFFLSFSYTEYYTLNQQQKLSTSVQVESDIKF